MFAAYGRHTQAGIEERKRQRLTHQVDVKPATDPTPPKKNLPKPAPAPAPANPNAVTPIPTPAMATRRMIAEIAERFGCTYADVVSKKRFREIVRARFAAIHAVRTANPQMSLPEIGRIFDRDHTTILHALSQPAPIPPAVLDEEREQ